MRSQNARLLQPKTSIKKGQHIMDSKGIILAAHRGDKKRYPENTMPAFIAAEKFGCDMIEMDLDTILDIADQPGTYLRTARCLEFLKPEMQMRAANNIREMGIEGIVVIGGDGSTSGPSSWISPVSFIVR